MPDDIPSFNEYLASLAPLTLYADPTASSPEAAEIKSAAQSLKALTEITTSSLALWARDHPHWVNVLGLSVGISQERLKNTLMHQLGTSGWIKLAREHPADLVAMLEREFDLVRLIEVQRAQVYDFGDILIARAGTRQTATAAGVSGRKVEDEIEAIAARLGLQYQTRTRFAGRNGRTAPCDLVIPDGQNAEIAVAAKGFDSTGSKQSAAVTEIEQMADVRLPRQYILAVVDGIGWKRRADDLRKIYNLWASHQIDGMYTLASLDKFQADLQQAAMLRGLLPLQGP